MTGAEDTMPVLPGDPDHPAVRYERRRRVDRELVQLRRQFIFLFILVVLSMVIISISLTLNTNRVEYNRYDLCLQRAAEIEAYNTRYGDIVPPFPVASCGVDPRTD